MTKKAKDEIVQIAENYNMAFITSLEAIMQAYDVFMHEAESIKDEGERDNCYAKIGKFFDDHLTEAWCAIINELKNL